MVLKTKYTPKKIGHLLFIFIFALLTISEANATPSGVDFFSVNSPNHGKASSPGVTQSSHSPATTAGWFEKFDDLTEKYHATDGDRVILTRPLMQQAERVQQWTNTANKIAKNYLLMSQAIKKIPLPSGVPDVKEYRDLMADWYQDAAGVYEELTRPRPPARTIEDLQEQLDTVKKRSESLAMNIANLKAMDRSLRQQYNVDLAPQDDVIKQFVKSK